MRPIPNTLSLGGHGRTRTRTASAWMTLAALCLVPACGPHRMPETAPRSPAPGDTSKATAQERRSATHRPEEPGPGLPFMHDYAAARALAIEKRRPIFAEVWAKW